MSSPPNLSDIVYITLGEVPAYLMNSHNISRTRQTVYNWAENGVTRGHGARIKLKTKMRAGMIYTTRVWVKRFLDDTSRY